MDSWHVKCCSDGSFFSSCLDQEQQEPQPPGLCHADSMDGLCDEWSFGHTVNASSTTTTRPTRPQTTTTTVVVVVVPSTAHWINDSNCTWTNLTVDSISFGNYAGPTRSSSRTMFHLVHGSTTTTKRNRNSCSGRGQSRTSCLGTTHSLFASLFALFGGTSCWLVGRLVGWKRNKHFSTGRNLIVSFLFLLFFFVFGNYCCCCGFSWYIL